MAVEGGEMTLEGGGMTPVSGHPDFAAGSCHCGAVAAMALRVLTVVAGAACSAVPEAI